MKYFTLLFLCIFSTSFSQSESDTVKPFLEDIVRAFPNVRDLALSDNEAIFSAQSVMGDISTLIYVHKDKNGWSKPKVLSFSGLYFDIEPFFSKDGLTLYFASNRPLDPISSEPKDFDIWYVTRNSKTSQWSEPKNLGAPVNTAMNEFYPVVTDSKNLYFTLDNTALKSKDDIYVSEFKNGNYTAPKSLGNAINSEGYEFNAFVAPDESFLIYSCYNRKDGLGSGDLYISYRDKTTNEWSKAKNMGKSINSNKMDYCPFVDLNTNTLYFTSKRVLVKTPSSKMTLEELKSAFNVYQNGLSRLYKTMFQVKSY